MSIDDFYDPDLYSLDVGIAPRVQDQYVKFGKTYGWQTVLEVGCGTGAVAFPLMHAGIKVIGVDSSRRMLDRCEQESERLTESVRSRLVVLCGSVPPIPEPSEPLDAILLPNDFISHILTEEHFDQLISSAAKLLSKEAHLVIDFVEPPRVSATKKQSLVSALGTYPVNDGGHVTVLLWDRKVGGALEVTFRYEMLDEVGAVIKTWYRRLTMRQWYREHVLSTLASHGFQVEHALTVANPGSSRARQFLVARNARP